jgi:hypothetical protein
LWSSAITGQFTLLKLGQVSASTLLSFDYRLSNYSFSAPPYTALLNSPAWGTIDIQVSACGGAFTTIQSINPGNHVSSSAWANTAYSLAAFSGQDVTIRVNTANWTAGDCYGPTSTTSTSATGCTGRPGCRREFHCNPPASATARLLR